jgi:hypothetical protein
MRFIKSFPKLPRFFPLVGSPTECRYQLMTYGFPVADLPLTASGTMKTRHLAAWLKSRKAIDTASIEGKVIREVECPMLQDVLFSNGGGKWSYPGNVAFREVLESKRVDFLEATSNTRKKGCIQEIIVEVTSTGGRFLSWSSDISCWMILAPDSNILYDRVMVAMRDHIKRENKKTASQQDERNITSSVFSEQTMRKRKHTECLYECIL